MKKLIFGLAALFLTANVQAAPIAVNNGGFETGDFTGWDVNVTTGTANVVTTESGVGPNGDSDAGGGPDGPFGPTEGTYFASLTADSSISQAISWGYLDTLSFDWLFNAEDYCVGDPNNVPCGNFNDYSIFQIPELSINITLADVLNVGDYVATGWNTFTQQFGVAGDGTLIFGVFNVGDQQLDSELYIDKVGVVPEPSILALLGLGLLGVAGFSRRKKDA